ncbi:MAG: glycosyltransferase family 4 protein [Bacteroidales bacterium]|nr:glycosyltransferase family 4 protein [Bacteroidales bacterium]
MKILYLHNAVLSSQMANLIQVKAMCNAMGSIGIDVTLSLSENKRKTIGKLPKNSENFTFHFRKSVFTSKRVDKYLNWHSVKNVINVINPDICYLRSPLLLRQTLNSGKPIIIELHNNKLHLGYNWLDYYWKKVLIKAANTSTIVKIVCISKALSDYWIAEGLPEEKVITAHDGIHYKMFQEPISSQEARNKLGLPDERKIVTYVGRLYKNRKIENIIKLAEAYPEALFLIVGGPNEQSDIYKRSVETKKIKNVIITGQIPHNQISDYLYASDVLLALWSSDVTTINYCSPLKVFEYMAAGRIIVSHGFPTIKEVLTHNHNAILVEPDSLEDLIQKTGDALKYKYHSKIAEQARKDVINGYTWDQRAKLILQGLD